jgi:hypothetical protein
VAPFTATESESQAIYFRAIKRFKGPVWRSTAVEILFQPEERQDALPGKSD